MLRRFRIIVRIEIIIELIIVEIRSGSIVVKFWIRLQWWRALASNPLGVHPFAVHC